MKNDGHYLEQALKDEFNKAIKLNFMWRRLPDTKSSKGGIVEAQPADFFCSHRNNGPYHIECKSRGVANYRLGKFDQLPLMRRWSKAGVPGIVLCHFYKLGEEILLVNVDDLEEGKASWDVSKIAEVCPDIESAARAFYE